MGELFMFAIVETLVELVAQGQGLKADNFRWTKPNKHNGIGYACTVAILH